MTKESKGVILETNLKSSYLHKTPKKMKTECPKCPNILVLSTHVSRLERIRNRARNFSLLIEEEIDSMMNWFKKDGAFVDAIILDVTTIFPISNEREDILFSEAQLCNVPVVYYNSHYMTVRELKKKVAEVLG